MYNAQDKTSLNLLDTALHTAQELITRTLIAEHPSTLDATKYLWLTDDEMSQQRQEILAVLFQARNISRTTTHVEIIEKGISHLCDVCFNHNPKP